jgi:hypothetical protein
MVWSRSTFHQLERGVENRWRKQNNVTQTKKKWLCCSYSTPKTDANLRIYTQTKYPSRTILFTRKAKNPPGRESENESERVERERERRGERREWECVCEIERAKRRERLQHVLLFLYSTNMCVLVLYCSYCYVCVLPPTHPPPHTLQTRILTKWLITVLPPRCN